MTNFPKDFFWGTATSAHQIEGDNTNNDWWAAEQKGLVPHKSGKACDSYNRYEEDFNLAKEMNNNAHRFSIEWARIEPEEGKFDERELRHYYNVLQALHARGIEPVVTLHHITNPKWFADLGGWSNKRAPEYFARYVEFIASNLGHEARYWITINEPELWNTKGYLGGMVPPFHKLDITGFWRARANMIKAHKRAYKILHKIENNSPPGPLSYNKRRGGIQVGIAQNLNYLEPAKFLKPVNSLIVRLFVYFRNFMFLDSVKSYQDFIGINYYNHYKISFMRGKYQDGKERSDFGWEIYPMGLYYVIKENWQRYKKPIYITENGISDADDNQRPEFIKSHLTWLHKAMQEGADVRGYFHWSLLDNYEWTEGFNQRFGLVEVNFDPPSAPSGGGGLERKMRPSGKLYAEIAKNDGF